MTTLTKEQRGAGAATPEELTARNRAALERERAGYQDRLTALERTGRDPTGRRFGVEAKAETLRDRIAQVDAAIDQLAA